MTLRISLLYLGFFAACVAILAPSSTSLAQECTSDGDCAVGQVCSTGENPGFCDRAPCSSDADCPGGFACELSGPSSGASCPAGAECPQPPPPAMGCAPQPIPCEVDADCPLGLSCVDDDSDDASVVCSDGPEGPTCSEPDAEPEPPGWACAFAPVMCESNADCNQAGYECTLLFEREVCEGTDTGATCVPGEMCPAPESEPPPECETRSLRICFPSRRDCIADTQCNADWSCLELPDEDDVPPGFEGATAVCVPEGIALLATDQIDAPNVDVRGDAEAGGGSALRSTSSGTQDEDSAQGPVMAGDDGGLCSVARGILAPNAPAHASSLAAWLMPAALLLWRRRRSASR